MDLWRPLKVETLRNIFEFDAHLDASIGLPRATARAHISSPSEPLAETCQDLDHKIINKIKMHAQVLRSAVRCSRTIPMPRLAQFSTTRAVWSAEPAATPDPKIEMLVNQIATLNLLETASLVEQLKVAFDFSLIFLRESFSGMDVL